MDQPRHIFKRVKERSIMDAKNSVDEWRNLFKNGELDQNGNKIKYSLKQAAEKVGVPKKTLEDYHQLLKKAQQIIDLNEVGDKKMGFLRNLLKFQQQQQMQGVFSDEENFMNIEEDNNELEQQQQQQQQQQQVDVDDLIVDGEIKFTYLDDFLEQYQVVQTVVIHRQQTLDKKLEIPYSDFEDCETDEEFDNQ